MGSVNEASSLPFGTLPRSIGHGSRPTDRVTPLMGAARAGSAEIVQMLLERGADPHAADSVGHRAIDYTSRERSPAVHALLDSAMKRGRAASR